MNVNNFLKFNNIKSRLVFGYNTSKKVDISILIPTYKRIDLLRKNINSIEFMKKPLELSYEVIIVSNDENFNFKELKINLNPNIYKIYVNESNLEMCGNMNRCVSLALGTYVAYIQDDDVLLPNYFVEIEKVMKSKDMLHKDCIIPNRFFLMDKSSKTQFGAKATRNIRIKRFLSFLFRFGVKNKLYKKVDPYDTLITTYPFYAGGPTCGILFKKASLLSFGGFDYNYPYGFDYMFFMKFSEVYNVYLYNKFLAIYMTSESASNKSIVQYDFFKVRYDYLLDNYAKYKKIKKYKDLIIYVTYLGYPKSVQNLIDQNYCIKFVSRLKCTLYKLWSECYVLRSGGYRRKVCTNKIYKWYKNL